MFVNSYSMTCRDKGGKSIKHMFSIAKYCL